MPRSNVQAAGDAPQFWDPAMGSVTAKLFQEQNEKLKQSIERIKAHPFRINHIRTSLWVGAVVVTIVGFYFFTQGISLTSSHSSIQIDLRFLILPFLAPFAYSAYIKNLQRDLVCSLFAQKHGWIYNPSKNLEHAKKLASSFPALFNRGHGQFVEDEFWGTVELDGISYSFWKAPFTFTVGSGKSSHTYKNDAIALRLPKTIHASLILTPEGFSLFGEPKDDLKTESMEFNRTFTIRCPKLDPEKKERIVRALSPAVQLKLLELRKSRGEFLMHLERDTIVFCLKNTRQPVRYCNFFKKVEIDDRDSKALDEELKNMIGVTAELLKYLD